MAAFETGRKTGQTPEGRLQSMYDSAAAFSKHLTCVPGSVLEPNVRLGVAMCARDALLLKDGKDKPSFHLCSDGFKHEPAIPTPPSSVNNNSLGLSCLATIVHVVVNHQEKVDNAWYYDAIQTLKGSGLVGGSHDDDDKDDATLLSCQSAYAEVVCLTVISHALHIAFLVLGKSVPALPSWKEMETAPAPTRIHFPSFLRQVRYNKAITVAPYYLAKDIQLKSPEFQKLTPSTQENLCSNLAPVAPYTGLFMAPEDFMAYLSFFAAMYMHEPKDVISTWPPLDSEKCCPSVSRNDVEAVATSISKTHSCAY